MWREELPEVVEARTRPADVEERWHLHLLGDSPVVADLTTAGGGMVRAASTAENGPALLGPFPAVGRPVGTCQP